MSRTAQTVTYDDAIRRYDPVLGIEVHVELGTRTKMFDDAPSPAWGDSDAEPNELVTPVTLATVGAAITTGGVGLAGSGIEVALPAQTWAWLIVLALAGQVVSWVLIGRGAAGLSAGTAGALLLIHPVLSVLLGMLVLGETLTAWQAAGCLLVVATVGWITRPSGRGAGRWGRLLRRYRPTVAGYSSMRS